MRQQSAQLAEAETLKSFIDSTACCESCRRDHLAAELKINRGS
jgi:hypothetical protein